MTEVLDRLLRETDVFLSRIMNRGQVLSPRHTPAGTAREHPVSTDDDVTSESWEFLVTQQPTNIEGQMRNYQIEGLDWLAQLTRCGVNGILADEMGLGKTLQSISILALAEERGWKEAAKPHLIICPKSTITNWENEFKRFCPSLSTCCLIGSAEERLAILDSKIKKNDFKVLITSFDVARIEIATIRRIGFGFFILDEAHRIKNEESILSSIVRMVSADRIFLLTGTPLQNNLHELWAILNFIMPNIFANSTEFDQVFNAIIESGDQDQVASTLHRILRPFMLRRLKTDVARDLPEKKELYVHVQLSPLQRQIYKDIILKNSDSVLNTSGTGKVRLVNTLMQLRKCCNHPYLFPGVEPGPPYVDGPHLVENSGKLLVVDKLIQRILDKKSDKNQILIFSQMTKMLDILDDYCRSRGISHCRIDGSTASSDRQLMIDDFVRTDSDKKIFLLSTRAGGLGINLVSANFVFVFDADFNPQSDLQAIDRAHRIGQKRPVTVYRFVCSKTVEEKIVEKAAKKMLIDKLVIQKGKFGRSSAGDDLSKDEISHMLRFGVSELFDESATTTVDQDIDALLAFSQEKTDQLTTKLSSFDQFVLKFDNPMDVIKAEQEENDSKIDIPEEIKIAAEIVTAEQGQLERLGGFVIDGPRERKPVVAPEPKRVNAAPVIKTKLAEWRAKVGGGHDYQFYDHQRLDALEKLEKERGALTRYEKAEQEKLMGEGFPNFSRRCFQTVTRLLEEFGPSDTTTDMIGQQVPEWSRKELERYIDTLFKHGKRFLGNHFMVRFNNKIKKIEEHNDMVESRMGALNRKINDFSGKNIWMELVVDSAPIEKGAPWTNDTDRVMLCGTFMFRYGAWSGLKQLLRCHPRTRLNFPLHLKSADDIKARLDELLEIVEEEFPKQKKQRKLGASKK